MSRAPRVVSVAGIEVGEGRPLVLILGPCVVEGAERTRMIATRAQEAARAVGLPMIFKSSFDKANRTSVKSFRGPGMDEALEVLAGIKRDLGLPILTDVHKEEEAEAAAKVADVLQIPAFLCRQTDLVLAAARTGRVVNVKKGQFLSPFEVEGIVEKIESTGNLGIMLTERGSTFGYQNLVVDFRALPIMRATGYPVVFDATHAVQLPGAKGGESGGQREFVPYLARAAVAAGADAIFMEVHDDPARALSDRATQLPLADLPALLADLAELDALARRRGFRGRVGPV